MKPGPTGRGWRGQGLCPAQLSHKPTSLSLQEQPPSLCPWPAPSWHFPALSWLPGSAPARCPLQGRRARGPRARAGPSRDWSRPARPWQLRCGPRRRALALRSERGEGAGRTGNSFPTLRVLPLGSGHDGEGTSVSWQSDPQAGGAVPTGRGHADLACRQVALTPEKSFVPSTSFLEMLNCLC